MPWEDRKLAVLSDRRLMSPKVNVLSAPVMLHHCSALLPGSASAILSTTSYAKLKSDGTSRWARVTTPLSFLTSLR